MLGEGPSVLLTTTNFQTVCFSFLPLCYETAHCSCCTLQLRTDTEKTKRHGHWYDGFCRLKSIYLRFACLQNAAIAPQPLATRPNVWVEHVFVFNECLMIQLTFMNNTIVLCHYTYPKRIHIIIIKNSALVVQLKKNERSNEITLCLCVYVYLEWMNEVSVSEATE